MNTLYGASRWLKGRDALHGVLAVIQLCSPMPCSYPVSTIRRQFTLTVHHRFTPSKPSQRSDVRTASRIWRKASKLPDTRHIETPDQRIDGHGVQCSSIILLAHLVSASHRRRSFASKSDRRRNVARMVERWRGRLFYCHCGG